MTDDELRFAVMEAICGWEDFDAAQVAAMHAVLATDQIDMQHATDVVRDIATAYSVGWNIPRASEELVVDQLLWFRRAIPQGASLTERATLIEAAVYSLRWAQMYSGFNYRYRAVSAMTKLAWFVAPERWTLFDDLAATGAGVGGMDPVQRMKNFFQRLECCHFLDVSAAIQKHLNASIFADVHGERVLDKYLVCNGQSAKRTKQRAQELQVWHDNMLPVKQAQIDALVTSVLADASCRLDVCGI